MPDVKISALPAATGLSDADVFVVNQGSPTAITKKVTYDLMMPTVGTNTGQFGTDSQVAQVTVDSKGRVTAAANVAINASNISTGTLPVARGGTGAATFTAGTYLKGNGTGAVQAQVGVPPTDLSATVPVSKGGTGATTLTAGQYVKGNGTNALSTSATIPVADITGTLPVTNGGTGAATLAAGYIKGNGTSALTSQTGVPATDLTGTIAATNMPALSGDVTSTAGSTATTLASTGVTAATYGSASQVAQVTLDEKGRATAASNVTITPAAIGAVAKTGDTMTGLLTVSGSASNPGTKITSVSGVCGDFYPLSPGATATPLVELKQTGVNSGAFSVGPALQVLGNTTLKKTASDTFALTTTDPISVGSITGASSITFSDSTQQTTAYRPIYGGLSVASQSFGSNTFTNIVVTVTGALLGNFVDISFSASIQDLFVQAFVSAANQVTVKVSNFTGSAIVLPSGTWLARIIR